MQIPKGITQSFNLYVTMKYLNYYNMLLINKAAKSEIFFLNYEIYS